jgi:GNAT superfamily N-acetyltransferase
VTPEAQGRGVGSGMLEHALDRCEREGIPAYLDATSERSKELYERHGFVGGTAYAAEGAPPFYPMWRLPA